MTPGNRAALIALTLHRAAPVETGGASALLS